ncbi:reverse transcriptase domain-containing protein [Tanacetum coccineum]
MSSQQKNKFFKDVKHLHRDDPFLIHILQIKSFDGVSWAKREAIDILKLVQEGAQLHQVATNANLTARKVFDAGFFWPTIYQDAHTMIKSCDTCQRQDRVLLFKSRLKIFSGKLKTRWSGPFTITKVFPYEIIELSQPDGHRVKHYFGEDVPKLVVPDLQTFPKDK